MTLNRRGLPMALNRRSSSGHRKHDRKVWLTTGTLALGVVAVSGGVATAALDESGHDTSVRANEAGDDSEHRRGEMCLELDEQAQRTIIKAASEANGEPVTVPLNKVRVLPCLPKNPAPTRTPSCPPTNTSSKPPPAPPTTPPTDPSNPPTTTPTDPLPDPTTPTPTPTPTPTTTGS